MSRSRNNLVAPTWPVPLDKKGPTATGAHDLLSLVGLQVFISIEEQFVIYPAKTGRNLCRYTRFTPTVTSSCTVVGEQTTIPLCPPACLALPEPTRGKSLTKVKGKSLIEIKGKRAG